VIRNYAAVTGALMAFDRSTFDSVGGFDATFPIDYNDVDFCLRTIKAGLRVVCTPYARMVHFESASAPRVAADALDERRFRARWGAMIARDPYYNVNLRRDSVLHEPLREV
jgi:GT2 family glycosyltransferase